MDIKMQLFRQEGTQMYMGVMRVEDILMVADVDEWRSEDGEEAGYQRTPESARTGRVARYLQTNPKPLMPTSVLLSYRGTLQPETDGDDLVTVSIPEGETLWIVDGQHRLYGFKRAIDELGLERLKDYYYELRGWDINAGVPTREKLEELGLNDVADELGG